jgi:hypothetical protein
MKKDQSQTFRLSGADRELLDQLAAEQSVSHAEVVRRAPHLLAAACGLGSHPMIRP